MSTATGAWRVSYTPGRWLVLTGPTAVVILQPASPQWSELIATIWADVLRAATLHELAAGMSAFRLDEMPSFAAFFWSDEGMRSLLRGDVTALDAASGDVVAAGTGMVTWNEVGLGSLERVRIQLGPETGESELVLPLVTGVVTAGSLVLDCSPDARVSSPQQPASAVPAGTVPAALAAPVEPLAPPEPVDQTPETVEPEAAPTPPGPVLAEEEDGPDFPPIDDDDDEDDEDDDEDDEDDTAFDLPVIDPTAPMPVTAPAPVGGPGIVVGDVPSAGLTGTESDQTADDAAEDGRTVFASTLPGLPQHADRTVPAPPPPPPSRPVVARLVVSDGERAEVDRPVLVGRAPTVTRVSGSQLPTLLTVESPSHDISRTHLEFAPRDGRLVVTDLHSTNGTVLHVPGAAPRDLEPGEAVEVAPGSLIDLGDGVTITVESI